MTNFYVHVITAQFNVANIVMHSSKKIYSVTIVFFFPTRMVMNELDLLPTTLVSKNDVNLANFNCNQHDFKKEMRGKMK